ncbi:YgiQ family radical SAM protein [Candidatus Woesearchaeota archaeon]|nr:YgiQ family radical SAM protein [Candidatus Woesearchaeota archaeon]
MKGFLPTTAREMNELGWEQADIIIVSGDAYIDHPMSGTAIIGRLLESKGYRVGIIDQPDWNNTKDFTRLGKPKLCFCVTGGHMDSSLAKYTPLKKEREVDKAYAGDRGRPGRAVVVYCNMIRQAYKDVPLVIGGVEASLRRLGHYDFFDNKVRRSIILDSRADVLVYGMGERQIIEICSRLKQGKDLLGIRGTAVKQKTAPKEAVVLPSFAEIENDKKKFSSSFMLQTRNSDPFTAKPVAESYGDWFVVQYPPAYPLSTPEMDHIYSLPFKRAQHPKYKYPLKMLEPILFSVVTHRGCFGGCSFCSINFHQGRYIQSRSKESILSEIKQMTKNPAFDGVVFDLGGPTANMYGMNCKSFNKGDEKIKIESIIDGKDVVFSHIKGFDCQNTCLPGPCKNLEHGHGKLIELLKEVRKIAGVKKAFVRSGVRHDLAVLDKKYMEEVVAHHVSGQLKVAPEHTSAEVLELMNKPDIKVYETFVREYEALNKKLGKKQYLVPYFIIAHPGSGEKEAKQLADFIRKNRIPTKQMQMFTPMPMTVSTCIYHTGIEPRTGKKVFVPYTYSEKKRQKEMVVGLENRRMPRTTSSNSDRRGFPRKRR